jgi:hypothetical protein
MEGRITTPRTTPGVQNRARRSTRKGNVKPDIEYQIALKCVDIMAFHALHCSQTKHPVCGYGRSATARHGCEGNLDANRQERMIRAEFILVTCNKLSLPHPSPQLGLTDYARQNLARQTRIESSLQVTTNQKEVEALQTACCTAELAWEVYGPKTTGISYPAPLPGSLQTMNICGSDPF